MPEIAPVLENDARRIITDAINRMGAKVSATDRDRITNDLAGRLKFDHEGRRMLVADQHGHPLVDIASDGSGRVIEIDLVSHLGTLVGQKAPPSTPAGDPANPWLPGSLNRTRQAILTNREPERAARLKREAQR